MLWWKNSEEYVPTNNKSQIDMLSNLNMILDSLSSDVVYKGEELHSCKKDQFDKLVAKRNDKLINLLFIVIAFAMNANTKFIKQWKEVNRNQKIYNFCHRIRLWKCLQNNSKAHLN